MMNNKIWYYLGIILDVILIVGLCVSILSGSGTSGDYLFLFLIVGETLITVLLKKTSRKQKSDSENCNNKDDLQL